MILRKRILILTMPMNCKEELYQKGNDIQREESPANKCQ